MSGPGSTSSPSGREVAAGLSSLGDQRPGHLKVELMALWYDVVVAAPPQFLVSWYVWHVVSLSCSPLDIMCRSSFAKLIPMFIMGWVCVIASRWVGPFWSYMCSFPGATLWASHKVFR